MYKIRRFLSPIPHPFSRNMEPDKISFSFEILCFFVCLFLHSYLSVCSPMPNSPLRRFVTYRLIHGRFKHPHLYLSLLCNTFFAVELFTPVCSYVFLDGFFFRAPILLVKGALSPDDDYILVLTFPNVLFLHRPTFSLLLSFLNKLHGEAVRVILL